MTYKGPRQRVKETSGYRVILYTLSLLGLVSRLMVTKWTIYHTVSQYKENPFTDEDIL